jgi:hypothetical protein
MPKPVKVITYLAVLSSFIYLLLTPQYMDVKIVGIRAVSGYEYALQHEIFELDIDGRTIRFITNGRGRFAIPKPSKLPFTSVELTLFPEGTSASKPEIPLSIPFFDKIIGRTKIVQATDGKYSIATELKANDLATTVSNIFIKSAYAEEDKLAKT